MRSKNIGSAEQNLLQLLDDAPLNLPYLRAIGVIVVAAMFDYFDFVLVGFIVAVIAPAWRLTYVETSIILASAGVGSIAGAIIWGMLADFLGRKAMLVWGIAICGLASGAVAFVPDGNWLLLTLVRFFVGLGVAGAGIGAITLAVELTPLRVRTMLTSSMTIPGSIGIFGAAILSAAMLPVVGWRGLALLGFAPLLLVVPAILWVPESVRWLMSQSRAHEARETASRLLRLPLEVVPPPPAVAPLPGGVRLSEVYSVPRRFWFVVLVWFGFSVASYGVVLWGPTILSLVLDASAADAARLYIRVSLAGLLGRIIFTLLPHWLGRRFTGQLIGVGIATTLGAASFLYKDVVGGVPLILLCLVAGALFFDGGASNLGPLSAEVFPARLAARGTGVGQAANGVGKIVGPLALAIIAGADNFVTPKATVDAAAPAFLFLASCGVLVWLAFALLGVETHRRSLKLDGEETEVSSSILRRPQ
jgi:putative MFS transporter